MGLDMCIFHKWGKWTQYESTAIKYLYGVAFLSTSIHQTRTCQRCGFSQDECLASKDVVKLKKAEVDGIPIDDNVKRIMENQGQYFESMKKDGDK